MILISMHFNLHRNTLHSISHNLAPMFAEGIALAQKSDQRQRCKTEASHLQVRVELCLKFIQKDKQLHSNKLDVFVVLT